MKAKLLTVVTEADSLIIMASTDWSHDHGNGPWGNNNSCGTMDHTARTGEDVPCLGGLAQHTNYGFRFGDQAYTADSSYAQAKRDYTGIWGTGGADMEGGFNQF
jgi:hypothetical protein